MPSPSRPFPPAVPAPRTVEREVAPVAGVAREVDHRPVPRLWRSRSDRVLAGVLGGLAEKFGWETKPLRILFTLGVVGTGGIALIPYLVLWSIAGTRGPVRPPSRIWRSRTNKLVAGVLGGLAERWEIRPRVLRVLYTGLTVLTGGIPGIVTYLVLWMVAQPQGDDDTSRR